MDKYISRNHSNNFPVSLGCFRKWIILHSVTKFHGLLTTDCMLVNHNRVDSYITPFKFMFVNNVHEYKVDATPAYKQDDAMKKNKT